MRFATCSGSISFAICHTSPVVDSKGRSFRCCFLLAVPYPWYGHGGAAAPLTAASLYDLSVDATCGAAGERRNDQSCVGVREGAAPAQR